MQCPRSFSTPTFMLLLAALGACTYEAPPEVNLVQTTDGVFRVGQDIIMEFSAPIDADSLGIRIHSGDRDIEGALLHTDEPLLATCRPADSPCPQNSILTLSPDGMAATLTLDPERLGQPDVPLALEVRQGLASTEGAVTGTAYWFDFQFKPTVETLEESTEDVTFMNGTYILGGTVDEPLPVILTLVTNIIVTSDGRVALIGAEADEIGDAPKNTLNPEELEIDATDQGFAVFAEGEVRSVDGERFLATDPFEINLVIGPVQVSLDGVRVNGIVRMADDGSCDRIEGTLSYDQLSIATGGGPEFDYEAATTTFVADFVPDDLIPEGAPVVCGDQCGAVTGVCDVPEGFAAELCDAIEAGEGATPPVATE